MDGLGRLKNVSEPDGTATQYGYDIRGNLTGVDVGSQHRAFEYDSLGRLTKACNPETGTANCVQSPLPATGLEKYTYDANGNTLTRTDARGTVTTMSGYDAFNRPASKAYTKIDGSPEGTPTVNWGYDQGRRGVLSSVSVSPTAGVFSTSYTYDALGRIKTSTQAAPGNTYAFIYDYSLTDRLSQIQYPSGRKVNYLADTVGRISSVQNESTQANYASFDYTAANGVPKMTLGNGILEQTSWNDRFQMTGLTAGKTGVTPPLALNYYHCPGAAVTCATGNNGTLRTQRIAGGGLDVTQSYSYDGVNRLTAASESGPAGWQEAYKYTDSTGNYLGNRWLDTSARSGLPTLTLETPQGPNWYFANNQINGWSMDSAGNVTGVGSMVRSFSYDAENRQLSATINGVTTTYRYDGDGRRVQKVAGTVVTTYVYDAAGELAAEYTNQTVPSACGTPTCYVTADHLGSTRLLTDSFGNVSRRYDYLPFGVELFAGTNGRTAGLGYTSSGDGFSPKFTGMNRDAETGLDYFNARYYSAEQGRFTSPDPGNAGAHPADPQTWNGYAYVNNSPLNYTDPSGMGFWSTFGRIVGTLAGGWLFGGIGGGSIGGFPSIGGANDGPWNERLPVNVGSGPTLNTGGVFGSGNTSPYIWSLNPTSIQRIPSFGMQDVMYNVVGWGLAFNLLSDVLTGSGPRRREYDDNSLESHILARSKGFSQLLDEVRGACRAGLSSGPISLGTVRAGLNVPNDVRYSPTGAQVGGYTGGKWKINGDNLDVYIPNYAGANSLFLHIPPNSPFSSGPLSTIRQNFRFSVLNPCKQ